MLSIGIALIVLCSALNSVGQVLFRASVGQNGGMVDLATLRSSKFWGGIGIYALAILVNIYAFRFGDLIVLYPMTNLSLVWNLFFDHRVFGNRIEARRVVATAMIFAGCVIVVL